MGAEPYYYFVKYNPDIDAALQELREREFKAGRYNPVIRHLDFPIEPNAPSPGAQHDSIQEALAASDADGTRSILDLDHVSEERDFCAVAPLQPEELEQLFGTGQPTHDMIEQCEARASTSSRIKMANLMKSSLEDIRLIEALP